MIQKIDRNQIASMIDDMEPVFSSPGYRTLSMTDRIDLDAAQSSAHDDFQHERPPQNTAAPRSMTLGRAVATSRSPANHHVINGRINKPAALKPKTTGRKKSTALNLSGPLSQLTKNSLIPVRDIKAFIARPVEERRKGASKNRKAKTPRPLNSFMIYRSAYADRIKEYSNANNHQIVSAIAGASWAMETKETRDKFVAWAETEKEMHKRAFPDYKYSPGKIKAIRGYDDMEVDAADPDAGDSDADYIPTMTRSRTHATHQEGYNSTRYSSPITVDTLSPVAGGDTHHSSSRSSQKEVAYAASPYDFPMSQNHQNQAYWYEHSVETMPCYQQAPDQAPVPWLHQRTTYIKPMITRGRQDNIHGLQLNQAASVPYPAQYAWPDTYAFIPRSESQHLQALQRFRATQLPLISPTGMSHLSSLLDIDQSDQTSQSSIDPRLLSGPMGGAYMEDQERDFVL